MNKVEYLPPPDDVINRFSRVAGQLMATRFNDNHCKDTTVVRGLSGFIKALAQAEANNRNRQGENQN